MDNAFIAGIVFIAMLALIMAGIPVALAMLVTGIVGVCILTGGWRVVLSSFESVPYDLFSSYSMSVIPLFLLMGQLAMRGGMSEALFKAAGALLGHRRGGLAMAAIGACAAFGSICGSSLATASTMATVALPEMRRQRYSKELSAGCLAAGGTLGALIPPSVVLVIYAILAEQNIIKLFVASVLPAALAVAGYLITIAIYVRLKPDSAQPAPRVPAAERWRALARTTPVVVVFLAMLGGIYAGVFTPTEGAAVGAAGTGLVALCSRRLTLAGYVDCLVSTAVSTAMIFLIVLGATVFNTFLALTQLPQHLSAVVGGSGIDPMLVMALVVVLYIVLGCVMDEIAMILLTVPVLLPMLLSLDYGLSPEEVAIWFGVLVLTVTGIGMIMPPLGMNLFIVQAHAPEIGMADMSRGIFPFICADLVRIVALVAFPAISLWLIRAF